jgi:transposase
MDRAPAHRAQSLSGRRISFPFFSLLIAELNPIERLWQFLKRLWKNENFASVDALRVRVNQELEQVSMQQVQSLTSFDLSSTPS